MPLRNTRRWIGASCIGACVLAWSCPASANITHAYVKALPVTPTPVDDIDIFFQHDQGVSPPGLDRSTSSFGPDITPTVTRESNNNGKAHFSSTTPLTTGAPVIWTLVFKDHVSVLEWYLTSAGKQVGVTYKSAINGAFLDTAGPGAVFVASLAPGQTDTTISDYRVYTNLSEALSTRLDLLESDLGAPVAGVPEIFALTQAQPTRTFITPGPVDPGSWTGVHMTIGGVEYLVLEPVPTPGTLGLVGLGACPLARRRRRVP